MLFVLMPSAMRDSRMPALPMSDYRWVATTKSSESRGRLAKGPR